MSSTALAVQPIESKLAEFSAYVQDIEVSTPQQYAEVSQRVKDAKGEIKKIGFVLDPGIASAREHLDLLRNQKQAFVGKWEQQIQIGDGKAKAWLAEEDRKTRLEQEAEQEKLRVAARIKAEEEKRIADAAAKVAREARERELEAQRKAGEIGKREEARLAKIAAEEEIKARELAAQQARETAANVPTVTVEANRPKVAGVPRTMHYYAEMNDGQGHSTADKLIDAFMNGPAAQRAFLRQFIMVNEQAVGKHARDTKDTAKVQGEIPGVRAWNSY